MQTLTAAYSAAAQQAGEESWLKLWQRPLGREMQQAGVDDLTQMWYFVLAGLSARYYRASACPASIDSDGIVTVPLSFYVFPSALDLQYEISASLGTIGQPVYEEVEREFDLVFDQQTERELGYAAKDISYEFLTPAYNEYGQPIARPTVTFADGKATLSAACFCVLRVRCLAMGYNYPLTLTLQKYEQDETEDGEMVWEGYSIANIESTVQAVWLSNDELQSTELDIEIPECVSDYLATCDDGELEGQIGHQGGKRHLLFYSTCTGHKLGVRTINE